MDAGIAAGGVGETTPAVHSSGEPSPHISWKCFKDGVEDMVSPYIVIQDKVHDVFVC